MGHYLIQASYTTDAWAKMVKSPADRSAALKALTEKLGGKLEAFYFAFGDADVVAILDVPDQQTAVTAALAAAAAGHLKSLKTTPLVSNADAMAAMKKAGTLAYPAPK
jgi:uncharacterized protein with GYD domain